MVDMALGGVRWAEDSETWPSFNTELPGSPVGSGNFCLMLLPVQRPVLLHVPFHLVVLWKTESLLLELKSHSHFQLVQGSTVCIRIKRVHPHLEETKKASHGQHWRHALMWWPVWSCDPSRMEAKEGRAAVCPMYYMMVIPQKVPAPCGPSCIFQEWMSPTSPFWVPGALLITPRDPCSHSPRMGHLSQLTL